MRAGVSALYKKKKKLLQAKGGKASIIKRSCHTAKAWVQEREIWWDANKTPIDNPKKQHKRKKPEKKKRREIEQDI